MATAYNRLFGGCRALMAAAKSSAAAASAKSSSVAASAKSSSAAKSAGGKTTGITKVLPISPQLGKFLGSNEASRTDAVKQVWQYIKLHNLQNPANKKEIRCDEKLKTIFGGKDSVGFTEIARFLSQHFVKSA
ncbi:hypothetical protein JRO89_XS12G0002300 [Xanthoceras sorbifolium]|uniref:DM2 domain-containing protein n=1 Tax=Xanthoceras sorbifolium TaxID=99658 RepID=A0ABQ8HA49_9ROSI|nr:hypothetical protein JRO89_XS12G0002300 [Xanthoceras sorbifolium]